MQQSCIEGKKQECPPVDDQWLLFLLYLHEALEASVTRLTTPARSAAIVLQSGAPQTWTFRLYLC